MVGMHNGGAGWELSWKVVGMNRILAVSRSLATAVGEQAEWDYELARFNKPVRPRSPSFDEIAGISVGIYRI
jgi:hypothetical protein